MRTTHQSLAFVAMMISLSFVTSNRFVVAQATDVIDDPEAYAVYASVLPARFSTADTDLTRVALLSETRAYKGSCVPTVAPEWASVIDNYKMANGRVRRLLPGFNLGLPYTLVPTDPMLQYKSAPDAERLSQVYAQFPNRKILELSAVGFDETKTRALVSVQYTCGFDCQGGAQLLKEKIDGHWSQPRGNIGICTWIS